jgi:HicA toxin of bacterial toxin-antitoxin,
MSKFDKLRDRLLKKPTDFTYDELRTILGGLGYQEFNKGKTSGSRVAFISTSTKHIIRIHKPHPKNIIKAYALQYIIEELKEQGLL